MTATVDIPSVMARIKAQTRAPNYASALSIISGMTPNNLAQLGITPAMLHAMRTNTAAFDMSYRQAPMVVGKDPAADTGFAAGRANAMDNTTHAPAPGTDDRGSDPAYNAARNNTNLGVADRGSDPAFQAANNGGASSAGYAPTLAQEQTNAQHNAMPLGADPGAGPAGGTAAADPTLATVTHLPDENMPNIPKVSLTWHDFTPQAQAKVAGAYAPLYQSIDEAKTNARGEEAANSTKVAGMYNQLDASNKADQTKTGARYDAAVNTATAGNAAQQTSIKGASDTANTDLAQLLASSGVSGHQGNAAEEILANAVGQGSAAQVEAQTAGNQAVANINAQKSDQLDYLTNTGSAVRQQGEATQEDLQNALTNQLSGYDQQTLQTKGQEAQQGLTLAQQMSQNDWTAQTGSADQTWNAYNAAFSQANQQNQNAYQNATLQNQAATTAANSAAAQADLDEKAREFGVQIGLDKQKEADDVAAAQAKSQADAAVAADNSSVAHQNADSNTTQAGAAAATAAAAQDKNSPTYLANHTPAAVYRQTLLGIAGNNGQVADAMQAWADSEYASIANSDAAKALGSAGVPMMMFRQKLMQDAASKGFTPAQAASIADAYKSSQGSSPTVLPAANY